MKEYFSIGELAELFGLNIQTLYYYDSVGIFSPRERNEKNGRRKYEFDQIYELATVSYMRRLGYSLEEIKESRTSLNSNRAVDIMKQRSQELRRQWQELLNIDEAIQRKIRFMEQEMDGICLDEIAVKHFEDRKFISIGDEELLYRENSFYFYPTIAFLVEGTGNTLAPTCIRMMRSCQRPYPSPESRLSRKGIFSADTIWEDTGGVPDTIRRLREARPDLELGAQAINFNILDQFVESDNENFITAMQIRVL